MGGEHAAGEVNELRADAVDGQQVSRGQAIAAMGSSDASRVELHFEVRLRGKPIDPMQVLPH